MRSTGLLVVGDEDSADKARELAKLHDGGLWGIRHDIQRGGKMAVTPLWLNAGTNSDLPTWSRVHCALYTADQVAAIALVLEDELKVGDRHFHIIRLF